MSLVLPLAKVHTSFTPANSRTVFATSPATMPTPLGAGLSSISADPTFALSAIGIEWFVPQSHSHDPHPSLTLMTFIFASLIASSTGGFASVAFTTPMPTWPRPSPTTTVVLNFLCLVSFVILWTTAVSSVFDSSPGSSASIISTSLMSLPWVNMYTMLVILPSFTSSPSFVLGCQFAMLNTSLTSSLLYLFLFPYSLSTTRQLRLRRLEQGGQGFHLGPRLLVRLEVLRALLRLRQGGLVLHHPLRSVRALVYLYVANYLKASVDAAPREDEGYRVLDRGAQPGVQHQLALLGLGLPREQEARQVRRRPVAPARPSALLLELRGVRDRHHGVAALLVPHYLAQHPPAALPHDDPVEPALHQGEP